MTRLSAVALLAAVSALASNVICLSTFNKPTPIVIWHGMGDDCCNPGSMGHVINHIKATLPGVYVKSIRIGASVDEDRRASFFGELTKQLEQVCEELKADPALAGGFNAIGFSQGGLFLRGLVQRCNGPPVHHLVTYGSPHMGVAVIPGCDGPQDFTCRLLRSSVYLDAVQTRIVQAQFFKDVQHFDTYLDKSRFLADINNERAAKEKSYADRLQSLKSLVLYAFEDDHMIVPKESALFSFWDASRQLVPMENQTLFTQMRVSLDQLTVDVLGGVFGEAIKQPAALLVQNGHAKDMLD